MPKIKMYVNTGFAGVKHEDVLEISNEEWDSLEEDEREDYLDDIAKDYLHNCIDYGAHIIQE
jgi:hypothetical protein